MIVRQTTALFIDAYRELNAKKLFWITMILSLLVVVVFAMTGVNDTGVSFLIWTIPGTDAFAAMIDPAMWYKFLFIAFGIGTWLTWVATILALISTAGIFPDLLSSGSIDLVLSKPISRLRLFLTKYLTGLLFAALQVFVFSGASFLVIGIRGGDWEPRILLAVPIVVTFFSYLFGICVLIGVITRSTIASLLLTLLVWFFFFIVNVTDAAFLGQKAEREFGVEFNETWVAFNEPRIESMRADIEEQGEDASDRRRKALERAESRLDEARSDANEAQEALEGINRWHGYVMLVKTFIPKTGETIGLLERNLLDLDELDAFMPDRAQDFDLDDLEDQGEPAGPTRPDEVWSPEMRVQKYMRDRSILWVVGTSLAFEGVMLAIAILVFSRRDF